MTEMYLYDPSRLPDDTIKMSDRTDPAIVSITQTGDELTLCVNEQRVTFDMVGAAMLVDSGSKALLSLIQRARRIE